MKTTRAGTRPASTSSTQVLTSSSLRSSAMTFDRPATCSANTSARSRRVPTIEPMIDLPPSTVSKIDAALKWLPGFRASYMDTIMGEADGQPGWLRPWFHFWITVQNPQAASFAWLVAVVETL